MKKFPRVAVIERVVQQMIETSELEAVQGGNDFSLQLSMKYGGPTPPGRTDDDVTVFSPSMKYGGPTHHAGPPPSDDLQLVLANGNPS